MRWPWITRAHHEDVMAFLHDKNFVLTSALVIAEARADASEKERRELTQALLQASRDKTPVKASSPKIESAPKRDFATMDPDDGEALVRIAIKEGGPPHSASDLSRRVDHLRRQIVALRNRVPRVAIVQEPPADEQEAGQRRVNEAIRQAVDQADKEARKRGV